MVSPPSKLDNEANRKRAQEKEKVREPVTNGHVDQEQQCRYTNEEGEEESFVIEENEPQLEVDLPVWSPIRNYNPIFHLIQSIQDFEKLHDLIEGFTHLGCHIFGEDVGRFTKPDAICFSAVDDRDDHAFFIRFQKDLIPKVQKLFESHVFIFHDVSAASDSLNQHFGVVLTHNHIDDTMLLDIYHRTFSEKQTLHKNKTLVTQTLEECLKDYLKIQCQPGYFRKPEEQLKDLRLPKLSQASKNLIIKNSMLLPHLEIAIKNEMYKPLARGYNFLIQQLRDCSIYERQQISFKKKHKFDLEGAINYSNCTDIACVDLQRIRSIGMYTGNLSNASKENHGSAETSSLSSYDDNEVKFLFKETTNGKKSPIRWPVSTLTFEKRLTHVSGSRESYQGLFDSRGT